MPQLYHRTLQGAVADHLDELTNRQPWVAEHRATVLTELADAWLAEGRPNWFPSLDMAWVASRLMSHPPGDRDAVEEFLRWAALKARLPEVAA